MGKLEEKNTKRLKGRQLQQIILAVIKTAGILSVAVLAPNVLGAMAKLGIISKARQREYVSSSASRLAKRGLLKFNGKYYQLTLEGKKILRRWELMDFTIKKPKRWDGQWRLIIFDIPEKLRRTRDQITSLFRQAGIYKLQNSVWVYPYDCEDIIGLLKTEFRVGKYLLYLIVSEVENDKYLREHFGLL